MLFDHSLLFTFHMSSVHVLTPSILSCRVAVTSVRMWQIITTASSHIVFKQSKYDDERQIDKEKSNPANTKDKHDKKLQLLCFRLQKPCCCFLLSKAEPSLEYFRWPFRWISSAQFWTHAAATTGCYAIISQPCLHYSVILFFALTWQSLSLSSFLPSFLRWHWHSGSRKPWRMFRLPAVSSENTSTVRRDNGGGGKQEAEKEKKEKARWEGKVDRAESETKANC